MGEHWFRPKTYGYGVSPANWKGWAATLAFVVVETLLCLPLIILPVLEGTGPAAWHVITYLALTLALTAGFVSLARRKTDGDGRWRWQGAGPSRTTDL
ncbi:MAG: hypothetical protein R3D57_11175 [Hyphomicrobiaceae bacterium]